MKKRDRVYAKYGGRCAYTGQPLDDTWQIDHVTPRSRKAGRAKTENNLVPCLGIINHYKRNKDLEQFRKYIATLQQRIDKLPYLYQKDVANGGRGEAELMWHEERFAKTTAYVKEVARLFGITPETPFDGTFYFETIGIGIGSGSGGIGESHEK